jgi:hypothetical protein
MSPMTGMHQPKVDQPLGNQPLGNQPLGMKDFQAWIYEGHPEYAVFAVKAPIETVGQMLMDKGYAEDWKQRVQSEDSLTDIVPDNNYQWKQLVQPSSNPWTVVYWATGYYENITKICQEIASTLETRVISCVEEDTSGAIGYKLYEFGKEIESLEGCPGDDLAFRSEIREEPELDDFESSESDVVNRFINGIFIEEGVYIPSWDLSAADPALARVDLILRR